MVEDIFAERLLRIGERRQGRIAREPQVPMRRQWCVEAESGLVEDLSQCR
jgi:hypothetical protein